MNKLPVKLTHFVLPQNSIEEFHVCKNCGTYTLLPEHYCTYCSNVKGYYSMDQFISNKFRVKFQSDIALLFLLLFISVLFIFVPVATFLTTLLGLIAIIMLAIYKFSNRTFEKKHLLKIQVIKDKERIKNGLRINKEFAQKKVEEGAYLEAYEILRNISMFMNDDTIKELKLECLNHFVIRKDMPLEMDTVIPEQYSSEFINYLSNAAKVQRNLVNKKVLEYVTTYEDQILAQFSDDVLVTIAGAALRMKQYFIQYEGFIMKYVDDMPKERIVRLTKLLDSIDTQEVTHSKERIKELIHTKYYGDSELMALL